MVCLGLDIGGTNCRFEWWPRNTLPGGDGPGVQPAVHGIDATVERVAAALAEAQRIAAPDAVVVALAGAGDAAIRAAIVAGLQERGVALPIAIVGDVVAAAAAGLADGPGAVVWSGTGSFAVARGSDGGLRRVGGRGHLLGDQGSGYDVVRRAAAAALLAVDRMGAATALVEEMTQAFGAAAPERLGAVLQRLPPDRVAAQLPVVIEVAARGDAVAVGLLRDAVAALADLADAAVRAAGLEWQGLRVALGGGVLTAAPVIADRLADALRQRGAAPPRTLAARAAATAAARLADGWCRGLDPLRAWVDGATP